MTTIDTDTVKLVGYGGGGLTVGSLQLNEWVSVVTFIFIVLQIGLLIPKWVNLFKGKKE